METWSNVGNASADRALSGDDPTFIGLGVASGARGSYREASGMGTASTEIADADDEEESNNRRVLSSEAVLGYSAFDGLASSLESEQSNSNLLRTSARDSPADETKGTAEAPNTLSSPVESESANAGSVVPRSGEEGATESMDTMWIRWIMAASAFS